MQGLPFGLVQSYLDEVAEEGIRNTQRERSARIQWQNHAKDLASGLQNASDRLKEASRERDKLEGALASAHQALEQSLIEGRRERYLNRYIQERLATGLQGASLEQVREAAASDCAKHLDPIFAKYGAAYDGDAHEGMRVGNGTYIGQDYQYVGEWSHDQPHGAGMRKWPDGTIEQGDFVQGHLARGEQQAGQYVWIGNFSPSDNGKIFLNGEGILLIRKDENAERLCRVAAKFTNGRASGTTCIEYFDGNGDVFATLESIFDADGRFSNGRIETKSGLWYEGQFICPSDFCAASRNNGLAYALDTLVPGVGRGATEKGIPFDVGNGLCTLTYPDGRKRLYNVKAGASDVDLWLKGPFAIEYPNGWCLSFPSLGIEGWVDRNGQRQGFFDVPGRIYGLKHLPPRYGTKKSLLGLGKPLDPVKPNEIEEAVIDGVRYRILHCSTKTNQHFRLKVSMDWTTCELIEA